MRKVLPIRFSATASGFSVCSSFAICSYSASVSLRAAFTACRRQGRSSACAREKKSVVRRSFSLKKARSARKGTPLCSRRESTAASASSSCTAFFSCALLTSKNRHVPCRNTRSSTESDIHLFCRCFAASSSGSRSKSASIIGSGITARMPERISVR